MTYLLQPLISVSVGVWISFFVLSGLGIFGVIFLMRRSLNKGVKKNASGQNASLSKSSAVIQKTKYKLQNIFARYGYLPKDALSRSFVNALAVMKYFVGGKYYRYRLPWFLVMGAEGSGKTSLLESLHMDLPIGSPSPREREGNPACEWRFYNHGIVLDLRGDLVLHKNAISSQEEIWHLLLDLLANHRPNRPLDGLVLTLSCAELMTGASPEEIASRADYLYLKFWQAQRILGIRLPVYVVVTKCDAIAGFSSFCNELPPETQEDILGWSSPYPADISFQPSWVEELFSDMKEQLLRAQQEIFAQGQVYNERDGVFVFPHEFQRIKNPLSLYLNHLFKESSYCESFFLRGVYFCGDASLGAKPLTGVETTFKESMGGQTKELGSAYEALPSSLVEDSASAVIDLVPAVSSIFFSTKLFREKIFREKGIARSIRHYFLANARSLRLMQMGGTALLIYGVFGLIQAYDILLESRNNIAPNLSKIRYIIQRSIADKDRITADKAFFEQQAQLVLNTLTEIHVSQLFSFFIPASWTSSLEHKIQQLLTISYDRIILVALSRKLYAQVQLVIDGKLGSSFETTFSDFDSVSKINPLSTPEFKSMREYVERLYEFQTIAIKLNSLPDSSSIDDLAFIVRKLFRFQLPREFYLNTDIYKRALAKTTLEPFRFNIFVKAATERLRVLYQNFLRAAFNPKKLSPDLAVLVSSLGKLAEGGGSYDTTQLYDLTQKISRAITLLNNPDVAWLSRDSFDPGGEFEDFLAKTASSYFFGQSTADSIIRDINLAFNQFKVILSTYKTPLTGTLFTMEKKSGSFSSDSLLKLQGLLNLLFTEPFMAEKDLRPIQTRVPPGFFSLWNFQKLNEAQKLLASYQNFLDHKLASYPKAMWDVLRLISLKGLRENIQTILANSQNFLPQGMDMSVVSPEEALLPQIQNLRAVLTSLSHILTGLKSVGALKVYGELRKVLLNQCLGILRKIDSLLESEGAYTIRKDGFRKWTGDDKQGAFYAFDVYNEEELKNYVNVQRDRIRYLAQEFAEPAVQLLQQIMGIESTSLPAVYVRWSTILTQLQLYYRKKSGNTLSLLEDFILVDLSNVTLKNCEEVTQEEGGGGDPSDFFLQKLKAMREILGARCKGVTEDLSKRDYMELSEYFNAHLAGRFPFASDDSNTGEEADPKRVQKFYKLFDEKSDQARQLMAQTHLPPSLKEAAINFIDEMENLRPLFQPLIEAKDGEDPGALSFSVNFRSNPEREINGNQIISWQMKIGDVLYDAHEPTAEGKWSYGLPIHVQFRFALGSPIRLLPSKAPKNASITPLTATFEYEGPWSLFHLLKDQRAPAVDMLEEEDTRSDTLKFSLPSTSTVETCSKCKTSPLKLAKNDKTVVFMEVKLLKTDKEGETQPFAIPRFPTQAPVILPTPAEKSTARVLISADLDNEEPPD